MKSFCKSAVSLLAGLFLLLPVAAQAAEPAVPVLSLGPAEVPLAVTPPTPAVSAGATGIVVPVYLAPDAGFSGGINAIQFAVSYDPDLLEATAVSSMVGSTPEGDEIPAEAARGWFVQHNIIAARGKVIVAMAGSRPLDLDQLPEGRLVELTFRAVEFPAGQVAQKLARIDFAQDPLLDEDPVREEFRQGTEMAIYPAPEANFRAALIDGSGAQKVRFTDTSQGEITHRVWDFDGDGRSDAWISDPVYEFAPGVHEVTLTVTGYGASSVATRQIRIVRPPQIVPQIAPQTAPEDHPIALNLAANKQGDEDSGDGLTWSVQVLEGEALLEGGAPAQDGVDRFTFTPKADIFGTAKARFTLTDPVGNTAVQVVVLTWTPVPDAPRIEQVNPLDGALPASSPLSLTWKGTDGDPGDELRYDVYLGTNSAALSRVSASQVLDSYRVEVLYPGVKYFWKVAVTDGVHTADSPVWSFIVPPDPGAPVIVSGPHVVEVTGPSQAYRADGGATVKWVTDRVSAGYVRFSETQAGLDGAILFPSGILDQEHEVHLTNLRGGQRYFYRVEAESSVSGASMFIEGIFTVPGGTTESGAKRVQLPGEDYSFSTAVQAIRRADGTGVERLPRGFALASPYPNPFNPWVALAYSLPEQSAVKLVVYNTLGQQVRTLVDQVQGAGTHRAVWDGLDDRGRAMAGGLYFVRFEAGAFLSTCKVLMLK